MKNTNKNGYNSRLKTLLRQNPQLTEFNNRKKRFFWLKTAVTELLIIAFGIYIYSLVNTFSCLLFFVCICLLAPMLYKPFPLFLNKKSGKVTKIFYEDRLVQNHSRGIKGMHNVTLISLDLTDEKGRVRSLELDKKYERCFFEGDELVCLGALPYPINLTPHDNVACPYCGNIMPAVNKDCMGCNKHNIYKYR